MIAMSYCNHLRIEGRFDHDVLHLEVYVITQWDNSPHWALPPTRQGPSLKVRLQWLKKIPDQKIESTDKYSVG